MTMTREQFAHSWRSWYMNDLDDQGPEWLQWLWTSLFCMGVGLIFTVLGMAFNAMEGGSGWTKPSAWLRWYGVNLVVSLCIGYTIHLLFTVLIPLVGRHRIRRFSNGQRALFFSGVPIVGVMIGWPMGTMIVGGDAAAWMERATVGTVAGIFMFAVLISFIFFQIFNARAQQAVAEQRATEAQLRLLQAQMEPHFLFNTLANVITLIEADPPQARRTLEAFTDYLRSSLTSLRRDSSTLGRELELARAYLALAKMRMEDRLRVEVDVDEALLERALPPLLLQPLVENAVVHGLEPKVSGGRLRVTARGERHGGMTLVVEDDGQGPDTPPRPGQRGNGVALANLRERLRTLYGRDASLALEATHPGTRVTLRVPAQADLAVQPSTA